MDCLVAPVSILRRRSSVGRRGYRRLRGEEGAALVRVVVGKERRVFLVEPVVLEESPFRVLMEAAATGCWPDAAAAAGQRCALFVDVDDILFEHLLWLLRNDAASLLRLNLAELLDFYGPDF